MKLVCKNSFYRKGIDMKSFQNLVRGSVVDVYLDGDKDFQVDGIYFEKCEDGTYMDNVDGGCVFDRYTEPELETSSQNQDLKDGLEILKRATEGHVSRLLGVTTENEKVSAQPNEIDLRYAKSYYDNYIKVAKAYTTQFNQFAGLICSTAEEKKSMLIDNLGWVTDCVQDRICKILGIDLNNNDVMNILHDSFMDMESFDIMIERLKLEGVLK